MSQYETMDKVILQTLEGSTGMPLLFLHAHAHAELLSRPHLFKPAYASAQDCARQLSGRRLNSVQVVQIGVHGLHHRGYGR